MCSECASDEDWVPSHVLFRADGTAPQGFHMFSTDVHDMNFDDDLPCAAEEPAAPQLPLERRDGERRGKYDRSNGRGDRKKWSVYVQEHMSSIDDGSLTVAKRCGKECPNDGRCNEVVGSIATLKTVAAESFGTAVLQADWAAITQNHSAVQQWFVVARAGCFRDATGAIAGITYKVEDHVVCLGGWASMRGVPPSTADRIERRVLAGDMVWNDGAGRLMDTAARKLCGHLTQAAETWWKTRLNYYEMTTKNGLILHPRNVIWRDVYNNEFLPEMELFGHHWRSTLDPASVSEGKGTISTWYNGKERALQVLGKELLPSGKPFVLKSRAKHSAYKECADCQRLRLAVDKAIRTRQSPDVIWQKKKEFSAHLQWMMEQRRVLEQITQSAHHDGWLVENSDKCGDSCLYLPASARVSSDNTSKYKYRLALQANVYASKLYHLNLLLPNLTTGADFGITTFITGLVRMFQVGEVTSKTRKLYRGMDGGSENVSKAGLGMNAVVVHELHEGSINEVQQHRLPPDHSHYWLTDGTFSVIEGFLTHDGFPGCATVWDLIDHLRSKFSTAKNFKQQRVEITCLLVTFAFTKWLDGCVNADEVNRIGAPLVWRHWWCEEQKKVIHQYKWTLACKQTFAKDEWGPWEERLVATNDEESGRVEYVKVLRSKPAGTSRTHALAHTRLVFLACSLAHSCSICTCSLTLAHSIPHSLHRRQLDENVSGSRNRSGRHTVERRRRLET